MDKNLTGFTSHLTRDDYKQYHTDHTVQFYENFRLITQNVQNHDIT